VPKLVEPGSMDMNESPCGLLGAALALGLLDVDTPDLALEPVVAVPPEGEPLARPAVVSVSLPARAPCAVRPMANSNTNNPSRRRDLLTNPTIPTIAVMSVFSSHYRPIN
jgi:hypothetical protein